MFKRIGYWKKFYEIAKDQAVDCVHLHDPELLILAYFFKKYTDIKVVFDMHENFPAALQSKKIIGLKIPNWVIFLFKKIEKRILNKLDTVIFAEKSYKKDYKQLTTKTVEILNYPFKQKILSDKHPKQTAMIVYAGAMHEIRGFKEMLEVAKELKRNKMKFQLVLIGEIPSHLINYSNEFIKNNHLENQIKLTGRLDFDELIDYYKKADLGLALLHSEPNYLESLPTKIFEYMSFGIPYVASNFPLWEELVISTQSGLVVDPKNITEITTVVKNILDNRQLQLGINGRKAHLLEYNWEIEALKLDQLYKALKEERKN
ncbi:MAG: glycosyltransferase [Algoriella sp.]